MSFPEYRNQKKKKNPIYKATNPEDEQTLKDNMEKKANDPGPFTVKQASLERFFSNCYSDQFGGYGSAKPMYSPEGKGLVGMSGMGPGMHLPKSFYLPVDEWLKMQKVTRIRILLDERTNVTGVEIPTNTIYHAEDYDDVFVLFTSSWPQQDVAGSK